MIMAMDWQSLIVTVITSGVLSSVITYFFTKRKRAAEDVESEQTAIERLQSTIDSITKNYTDTLKENVLLKLQKVDYIANQKILESKIDDLTRQVEALSKQLNIPYYEKRGPTSMRVPITGGVQDTTSSDTGTSRKR